MEPQPNNNSHRDEEQSQELQGHLLLPAPGRRGVEASPTHIQSVRLLYVNRRKRADGMGLAFSTRK